MKRIYIYLLIISFIIALIYIYSIHKKCYDPNGYHSIHYDTQHIQRKVYKCILNSKETNKLLNIKDILVPSMIDNTYCDYLTTYYYNIKDFTLTSQYNPYHRIQIRTYVFNPNQYLELKTLNNKIRFKIKNYELINIHKIEEKYIKPIQIFLLKVKNKKIKPLFINTYKRYSFIYLRNPDIRITIDTNITFTKTKFTHTIKENIMEIKVPYNISINEIHKYIQNMNNSIEGQIKLQSFSKVKYFNSLVGNK
jgi:hypothetical protein